MEESDLLRDNPITEWSGVAVTFCIHIRELLLSSLGCNTDYPERDFQGLPQSLQGNI
jgi:hypothetical protein